MDNTTINYLTIPGAQLTREEREFLRDRGEAVRERVENPVIVTIGVLWAASMWCIRWGSGNVLQYGIDVKLSDKMYKREELNAEFIEGDSRVLWKTFDRSIDLLFIDGDHHYNVIREDIAGWTPKVVVGGVVIFHDYAPTQYNLDQFPHIAGVRRAVDEWQRSSLGHHWEIINNTPDSIAAFVRRSR